jgi:hypothetical protein
MIDRLRIAFALVLAFTLPTLAHATNLVQNGNFSSGLNDWTNNPNLDFSWRTGTLAAITGCEGSSCISPGPDQNPGQNYLYQDIATTVGDSYTLSFEADIRGDAEHTGYELQALFGGNLEEDITTYNNAYVTYTISGLIATSTSTQLEFLGRDDPYNLILTDVDVEDNGPASAATPEPAALTLTGTGLLALAGIVRRRLPIPN